MEAEPRPDDDTPADESDVPTPGDEPSEDIPGKHRRLPIPEFFSRRAFLSKDTGRWHKHPGGRDHRQDRPHE
jgi:hypothetical protein